MPARLLAAASGVALYEEGRTLSVRDRRSGGLYTGGFVCLLLTIIPGGFGAVVLALRLFGGKGIPAAVGLAGLAASLAAGAAFAGILKTLRRRHALPPEKLDVLYLLDFEAGQLRDGQGRVLAPLSAVTLARAMQLGSSSPALELRWEGGKAVLLRGNPFAGGLGTIEEELRRRLAPG